MRKNLVRINTAIISFLTMLAGDINAQWITNGPFGGVISAAEVMGSDVYAGTANGVFKSSDNGQSWTAANSGIQRKGVGTLAVKGNTLYAGTNYDGVFYSTNNGANWTSKNSGLNNLNIISLFSSTAGMFVSNSDSVYFSNGNGWMPASTGIPSTYPLYCYAQMGDTVFGGSYGLGLYFTANYGGSWSQVAGGFPSNTFVYALMTDGNNVYAGTSAGVYKSSNRGVNWSASNTGFPPSMWAKSFAVKPGYIFAGTYSEGMFVSTNNGASWTQVNNGIPNLPFPTGLPHNYPSIEDIACTGSNVVVASVNGVYLSSNNASQWSESNQGILGTDVIAVATKGNHSFAGEARTGMYHSSNNGASWQRANNGLTSFDVLAITANDSVVMVSVQNQKAFRSSDNGATWISASSGLPLAPAILKSDNNRILTITQGGQFTAPGLFQTTNYGNNWTQIPTGSINGMTALGMQGSMIYVGTYNGKVYRTSNNGSTWQDISMNLPAIQVNCITQADTFIYAGTFGQNIYKTSLNGSSWTSSGSGVTTTTVTDVQQVNSSLYASTWGGGVFTSGDQGASWSALNSGLADMYVRNISGGSSSLFAATDAGAYAFSQSPAGILQVEKSGDLSVYPNPTSEKLWMNGIGENAEVTMHNSLGKLVFKGRAGELYVGNLPEGVYILSIISELGHTTKKIVIQ